MKWAMCETAVSTLAGTREKGHRDGRGTVAQFDEPCGVEVDGDGNVIVADTCNHRIRKITPQGLVSTLAGTGVLEERGGCLCLHDNRGARGGCGGAGGDEEEMGHAERGALSG
jgi:DNA-binding beta-propeller fold protein YncE